MKLNEAIEATRNTLLLLEALGYQPGGEIHNDLAGVLELLQHIAKKAENSEYDPFRYALGGAAPGDY